MLLLSVAVIWMCAAVSANFVDDSVDRIITRIKPKISSSGLDPVSLDPFQIRIKSTWLPTFAADFTNSSLTGLSSLHRKNPCEMSGDISGNAFCRLTACSMEASLRASVKGDLLLEPSRDIDFKFTFALPEIVLVLDEDAASLKISGIFVDSFLHGVDTKRRLELNQARKEQFIGSLRKSMAEQLDNIIQSRYADLLRYEFSRLNSTRVSKPGSD